MFTIYSSCAENVLYTAVNICIMMNRKMREGKFALLMPHAHPPTHWVCLEDDTSLALFSKRRPSSHSRTLPAQKQQITALQTTVQSSQTH